jgi:hypothetical protein
MWQDEAWKDKVNLGYEERIRGLSSPEKVRTLLPSLHFICSQMVLEMRKCNSPCCILNGFFSPSYSDYVIGCGAMQIFLTFASVSVDKEQFMTPSDFIRSIDAQPHGSGSSFSFLSLPSSRIVCI